MGFYDEMQDMASELLAEFKQGSVQLRKLTAGASDPDTPWEPGTETTATYELDATVSRVQQKYVDGSLIIESDNQVTFAVPEVVPDQNDILVIDGVEHSMKDLRAIPAAGTTVAWIAFVAG